MITHHGKITSQEKEIRALVTDIHDGKLLLPELQRRYVWKAPQVRDLFDSLYRQYPSGQLLIWETDDVPYSRTTSVEGVADNQRRPQLLLDGQQRLTSLAAVMLGRPLLVRWRSRPIDIAFNVYSEKFEVAGPRQRKETGWISLTRFFTGGIWAILQDLKLDPSLPGSKQVFERLTRIENITTYKYRVNVLEDLDYETVTDIFVRVNSGGTTLGSADLTLAQVSSRWRGVTQEFDTYTRHAANQDLQLDSGLLLRAMAALLNAPTRLSQFFRGERQHVGIEELQEVWKRTKIAMDEAIAFLVQNCKIDRLGLLPTNNVLIPLAAFFNRFGQDVTSEQGRDLQRWVYMALIWSRYSGSVETSLDQDIAALSREHPIQGMIQNIEDQVGRRPVTERELRDQRKNSPYMLMAYVLARHANAADWFNGVVIGSRQTLEVHHIFPKGLLRDHYDLREDSRTVDQVANLAFLSNRANSRISNSNPVEYLQKIDAQRLKAQSVPLDLDLWQIERFEDFLLRRRTMLANAINSLLLSLTDKPSLWPISNVEILESRVNAVERRLRETINEKLVEVRGDTAWEDCVPKAIQSNIQHRIDERLSKNPFESSKYGTLMNRLELCQFGDYPKITKANWPLFADTFGSEVVFDQHVRAVTEGRNAFKHNRPLSASELASTEAGLLWIEDCLRNVDLADDEEIEGEAADSA